MNVFSTWQAALLNSWGGVWASVLGTLPAILGAIVVFAIGLVIAYWVKRGVVEVLRVVKLESLTKSAGIDNYLARADIKLNFVELVGVIFEWIIILVFFLAVVDILGLSAVSVVVTSVLGYIPNIVGAALIFGGGYVVAKLVDGLVRGALTSIDKEIAKPLGKFARWLILLIAAFAAIEQLQIARGLTAVFFQGITYTVVLVVGLAIGLGSKDLVSKILTDWYEKFKK